MAQANGVTAEAHPASVAELVAYLRQGRVVIASVSYEAGDDRLSITRQGGHLIVVVGAECMECHPRALHVNNPSGRRTELQAGARLSLERFEAGYSGRIIVMGRAM
jgi:hypothetical protein